MPVKAPSVANVEYEKYIVTYCEVMLPLTGFRTVWVIEKNASAKGPSRVVLMRETPSGSVLMPVSSATGVDALGGENTLTSSASETCFLNSNLLPTFPGVEPDG